MPSTSGSTWCATSFLPNGEGWLFLSLFLDGSLVRGFRVGDHLRTTTAHALCVRVRDAYADPRRILSGADLNAFYGLVLEPHVFLPRLGVDTAGRPFSWFLPVATGDPDGYVSARRQLYWMHDAVATFRLGTPITPALEALLPTANHSSGDASFDRLVQLYRLYGPESTPVKRGITDWLAQTLRQRFPPPSPYPGDGVPSSALDALRPAFVMDRPSCT